MRWLIMPISKHNSETLRSNEWANYKSPLAYTYLSKNTIRQESYQFYGHFTKKKKKCFQSDYLSSLAPSLGYCYLYKSRKRHGCGETRESLRFIPRDICFYNPTCFLMLKRHHCNGWGWGPSEDWRGGMEEGIGDEWFVGIGGNRERLTYVYSKD